MKHLDYVGVDARGHFCLEAASHEHICWNTKCIPNRLGNANEVQKRKLLAGAHIDKEIKIASLSIISTRTRSENGQSDNAPRKQLLLELQQAHYDFVTGWIG